MDGQRFDRWTRTAASGSSRRDILKALAGGAVATTLALVGGQAGAQGVGPASSCKSNGSKCSKNNDCCSKNCKSGTCKCAKKGSSCNKDKDCCSGLTCKSGSCK